MAHRSTLRGALAALLVCAAPFALVGSPAAAFASDATADIAVTAYQGEARAPADNRLLYEEHHWLRMQDARLDGRLVLYRCPDGTPFARKLVSYGERAWQPQFELVDTRSGYREGFEEGNSFVQRSATADTGSRSVKAAEALVVDAGFDEFVRARWDALQRGENVRLDFLVPSRLASYGFGLKKLRTETIDDASASVFRLALTGMLGWFADAIEVSYRDSDRRLMRFEGLSNIRGDGGDNLIARIEFPTEREASTDQAGWDAAASETLQACALGG